MNVTKRVFATALHIRIAVTALIMIFLTMPAILPVAVADGDGLLAGQPKDEYRGRRQKLMERIKDGIIILVGGREEELGEVGRFRQKNDFMYMTGVEIPASYLIMIPAGVIEGKVAQETLFIPSRNAFQERWTGPKTGPGAEAEQKFGIQQVLASDQFKTQLRDMLSKVTKLYTLVPSGSIAKMTREYEFIESVKQIAPQIQIADISGPIYELRKLKSAAEMVVLQKAIDITIEGHRDAAAVTKPGAFEYQLQGALEYAFTRNGAERPGFPSIVGAGINSTILHYNDNRRRVEAGDLIVIDIGAEYAYYTADITRTYPATGKFTERQRQIYQLVLDAQRAAEKAFKAGQTSMADLQRVAIEVMRASPLRDRQGNKLDRYFIHGLGHWLGMDVHDVGSYGVIPVGAVFTIEPGIYIPEEKLGVRIEDDYLATEKGLVKLSGALATEADDVERMMTRGQAAGAGSSKQGGR